MMAVLLAWRSRAIMVVNIAAKEHAENHIRGTHRALHDEREKVSAEIGDLQQQLRKLDEQIADCEAAARVFDIDLIERGNGIAANREQVTHSPEQAKFAHLVGAKGSLKETVASVLEAVYPSGLTKIEMHGVLSGQLHLKPTVGSVGTLLYRCAVEDGTAKHLGRQWFFVPQTERRAGHENPGGDAPGLNVA
jgi:septal ring factor EnvC (AmiA/AmiB activator)